MIEMTTDARKRLATLWLRSVKRCTRKQPKRVMLGFANWPTRSKRYPKTNATPSAFAIWVIALSRKTQISGPWQQFAVWRAARFATDCIARPKSYQNLRRTYDAIAEQKSRATAGCAV